MGAAGCKVISNALKLHANDYLCDIGSGGGLTITQMTAEAGNKCSIGIEVEIDRHHIAVNISKSLIEKYPEKDFPVAFINADITSFADLNGITKLFMFDHVFPRKLLLKVAHIINQTTSIEFIVSTKSSLIDYGFNVKCIEALGNLQSRGGKMSHTFYLHKVEHHLNMEALVLDQRIVKAMSIATNKQKRLQEVNQHMLTFPKL